MNASQRGASGLLRILALAAVLVALLFAYREGGPWLRHAFDRLSGGTVGAADPGDDCIAQATAAVELFVRGARRLDTGPVDIARWDDLVASVDDRSAVAYDTCSCAKESCREATAAVRRLHAVIATFDGALQDGDGPPQDPQRAVAPVRRQLDAARSLAHGGH